MRWKVSKPVRLGIFLVENVLVLALAALVMMSTSWFQHVLERHVIEGVGTLTGGRVEIGYFRFNPWLFHIRIQKMVIHGSEASGSPPLVSVRELEAGLNPDQLLRQRVRLRHLDLDGLELHLRMDSSGVTNLPGPREQASPQQHLTDLIELSIGRLTLSHSALYWNSERQPAEINARDLAVLLRMERGQYSGSISSAATTIRSPRWSPPPVTVNGRFTLSRSTLAFTSLAWESAGSAGEGSFIVSLRPALLASGSFHASVDLAALAHQLAVPELRAGALQVEGLGALEGGRLTVQGRAAAQQVAVASASVQAPPFDLTTSYAFDDKDLRLTNLVVSAWGGRLQGDLDANLASSPPQFHWHSQVAELRLQDVLRSARTLPLVEKQLHLVSTASGEVTASWTGRGTGLGAEFDLALQAPGSSSGDVLPITGEVSGTLENGRGLTLQLERAEISTPHSTLSARGTLAERVVPSEAPEPLAITVSTDNFEEWRPLFEELIDVPSGIPLQFHARTEFSGQIRGSYEDPTISGRLNAGQFRYRDWTWDRLNASVAVSSHFVQVTDGRIEHDGSAFELSGSTQLDDWYFTPECEVQFAAQALATPVEGLEAAVGANFPLRGRVTGNMQVEGNASNLTGAGSIRIEAGAISDEPFDLLSTRLRIQNSVWKLETIQLTKGRGRLTGSGVLEPNRHFASGEFTATAFHLADIRHLPLTASTALPKGGLDGTLNFGAHGEGTPGNFHGQGYWHLSGVSVAGAPMGDLSGTLAGEGQQLSLTGEGQSSQGSLRISAQATARGDWPMEAQGEYSGVRGDPWIRAFLNREFGPKVTLTGSLHAAGPLRMPQKIAVQSETRQAAVDFPSVQWRNEAPIDVHYSDGRMTLNRFVMRGPSTELQVEGGVNFDGGIQLAIRAEGTANATALTIFDPNLEASGRSNIHLQVTGRPAHPAMNGAIEIHDVSLDYAGLPFRFSNLEGIISLEGERAVIRSLRGSSGGGTVTLSGSATLTDNPRFEGRAELNQVRLRYPASFTSVLDGSLRLAGNADQGQLQGELVIRQMVLNPNVNIISKFIEAANPLGESPTMVSSAAAPKIRMNIRVTSSPPIQVQTPTLRLVGDVDLRMQGTLDNPVQVGTIHLISGESVFRGNRYTLERGDISLTNPFRTQASLDMEVETRVQSYDLTLDISGTFDRLKFSYRSDPPLAQTDIISLLALGYVQQEQAFPALQGNPTTSVGASAILSQALSTQIGGRIQHLFGVSRIKIDPYVGMPGLGSGERVTVEEQITHDLTLTYITDTSYSQYTIYQFELNVSDNVSILGVRDPNGIFGLEFRFRHRFK